MVSIPISLTPAFEDFDDSAIGLGRGSAQVRPLRELHPAIVKVVP